MQQDSTQKVDAARRCTGIHIVWLNWLTDSLALWGRQDETPYLLHPTVREDAGTPAAVASPASDAHQISSDPDPDADDWDELGDSGSSSRALGVLGVEGPGPGPGPRVDMDGEFTPQEVDWAAANDEVDQYLMESDDEDEGGGDGGNVNSAAGGGGMSEDEGSLTDESNSIIRYVPGVRAAHEHPLPCSDSDVTSLIRL